MRKKPAKIYLDFAATTPLSQGVLKVMKKYLSREFGNPSSLHYFGQRAKMAVESAREKVAEFLNCHPFEIVFTGSATEANNLAILGVVEKARALGQKHLHVITTKIEHHAVLYPCAWLEKKGVKVTYLSPDKEGRISPEDVVRNLTENTVLVSVMYANNEVGTVQPISEIGKILKEKKNKKGYPFFHTDAVQAVNYLDCDVQKLHVDLLTLSGHKIYGPKGIGALFVREGTLLEPLILGGGQERGMRSGTENVAGIVGLTEAIEEVKKHKKDSKKLQELRDYLIREILRTIKEARLNGSWKYRLPNNVNVSIPGVEGESLVIALDNEGFAVSTGSACSSKSLEPSHVLLALGLTPKEAHGSLRITLGRGTTKQDLKRFVKTLSKVVERLKKVSPF